MRKLEDKPDWEEQMTENKSETEKVSENKKFVGLTSFLNS